MPRGGSWPHRAPRSHKDWVSLFPLCDTWSQIGSPLLPSDAGGLSGSSLPSWTLDLALRCMPPPLWLVFLTSCLSAHGPWFCLSTRALWNASLGIRLVVQGLRLRFHCRGLGFDPRSGNLKCCVPLAVKKKKKKKANMIVAPSVVCLHERLWDSWAHCANVLHSPAPALLLASSLPIAHHSRASTNDQPFFLTRSITSHIHGGLCPCLSPASRDQSSLSILPG